jgi:dienelactone hydrolase
MTVTVEHEQVLYLEGAPEPVYVSFHRPTVEVARDTAVILCPPFGWDEVCSYRSLRDWAARLAAAGYASLQLTFPGTGDSGGSPRDPDRVEAWTATATVAASWVREASGARRVVALGIGPGGLFAYRAAATGAPIDDLVLWGTPARARLFVRQLRAFSKLETSQFFEGLEQPPPLPHGELEAGGFLLTRETVEALGGLDLTALALDSASSRRVLLLERDGLAVDAQLKEHLEQAGARVTVAPGKGYAAMTSHPQTGRPPFDLIARVTAWLGDTASPAYHHAASRSQFPAGASESAELEVRGIRVREMPLTVEQPFGHLAGVLAEPVDSGSHGLCAVLLNAGAVRHIGPNRMWVEVARRWAARGIPTLRLDVEGIGDADGDTTPYVEDASMYKRELVPQVLAAVDILERRGLGERFVLGGLCAGAYWSFHAALQDARVAAALMVNPAKFFWDPALAPSRDFRALLANPTSWSKMRREASRERVRGLALWMLAAPKRALAGRVIGASGDGLGGEFDRAFDQLRAEGKSVLLVSSNHEALHYELIQSGRMAQLEQLENVTLEYIPVRDHTFRPIWAQEQVHAILDRALERELALGRVAKHAPSGEAFRPVPVPGGHQRGPASDTTRHIA